MTVLVTADAVTSAGGPVLTDGLRAVLDAQQGLTRLAAQLARLRAAVPRLPG